MLHPSSTSPADVIGGVDAQLTPLGERLWAAVSDEDLVEGIAALEEHEARLAAVRARMLAEIVARELPRKKLSWSSNGDWYAHLAGLTRSAGHRAVAHAKLLTGEREATLDSLGGGRVSAAQAGVVCEAIEKLPGNPVVRAEAEELLLDQAATLDATQLTQAGARILAHVDPDREHRADEAALAREERAAHHGRHLSITDDGAGGVRVRGRGTVEDAATMRAALLPLTKPQPAVNEDAASEGSGSEADPRDHGARMWDAMVGLAQHSLDTEAQPESHGARPRVGVFIDLESLQQDSDDTGQPAMTDDGLRLSHAAVRRLACDADILPICLGTQGQPLDVGRTQRLVTTAIWLALIARDRHCAFPGCTRPPVMCHAHHITHWADGGPTSLNNLVMLCGHHHRTIHDTAWQVRLATDGRPEFRPPPRRRDDPPPDQWIRQRPRLQR
jgi:hypothetical protein